jgi:hypothetical protein
MSFSVDGVVVMKKQVIRAQSQREREREAEVEVGSCSIFYCNKFYCERGVSHTHVLSFAYNSTSRVD